MPYCGTQFCIMEQMGRRTMVSVGVLSEAFCVVLEQEAGSVSEASLEVITELYGRVGRQGRPLVGIGCGEQPTAELALLGEYGLDLVLLFPVPAGWATVLRRRMKTYLDRQWPPVLVAPATLWGEEVVLGLASELDVPAFSNCMQLETVENGAVRVERLFYEEKIAVRYTLAPGSPLLATLAVGLTNVRRRRPGHRAEVVCVPDTGRLPADPVTVLGRIKADPQTMDLEEADVIVCGGRGLGSAENFALLAKLADMLGAAVGGTRVARDNGWITAERQIGQTGKVVKPELLLSFGVSGATQHTIGLRDSRRIVAVNKDKNAPMMKLADVAIVADAREVIVELIRRLEAAGAGSGRRAARQN